jgi:Xaa-Pro aminopeptidase
VRLAQEDRQQALEHAQESLAWIEANSTRGIEYPLQVYLTCYHVLNVAARGDASTIERVHAILSEAHVALLAQAAGISDPALRQTFLEGVKTNREIRATWEAAQASP